MFWVLNRPQGGGVTIVVPSPTPTTTAITRPAAPTPELQRININTASVELLDTLPGIGEVKAKAIVDYRNQQGPFHRIDELMNVPGIGPTTYQALRGLVTVGEPP
ncbi:MAG: ComEA family DNA-binding protein [Chloroflexota bacterium]